MTNEEMEIIVEAIRAKTQKIKESLDHSTDMMEVNNLQGLYSLLIGVDFTRIWPDFNAHEDPRASTEVCEGGVLSGGLTHGMGKEAKGAPRPPAHNPNRGMGTGVLGLNPTGIGYVKIAENGKEAKGMWDQFEFHTMVNNPYPSDERKVVQYWWMGRYNNTFVKENGRWRCLSHQVLAYFRCAFDEGWIKQPDCRFSYFVTKDRPNSTTLALQCGYVPSGYFYAQPVPEPLDQPFPSL